MQFLDPDHQIKYVLLTKRIKEKLNPSEFFKKKYA